MRWQILCKLRKLTTGLPYLDDSLDNMIYQEFLIFPLLGERLSPDLANFCVRQVNNMREKRVSRWGSKETQKTDPRDFFLALQSEVSPSPSSQALVAQP